MPTLELTLSTEAGDGFRVVAELRQGAPGVPVRRRAPLLIDREALAAAAGLDDYGAVLGEAVFSGELRDLFASALAVGAEPLRLLLHVEAEGLRDLRWERLAGPIDGGFRVLALSPRVLFSQYIPTATDRPYPPLGRRDLRALVVVSSPEGLADFGLEPFDVAAAVESVQKGLGELPADLLASGPADGPQPTLDELCNRLASTPYAVLHLVCHGRFLRREGETALYLADEVGAVQPVRGKQLIARLGRTRGAAGLPRLVFLSCCETAIAGAEAALGGLGQRLVRDLGTPAVVAMTETVPVATAFELNRRFYPRLVEHGEVDRAFAEALWSFAEGHAPLVPALFGRLAGTPLFSDDTSRPLSANDLEFGLGRLREILVERAPILAPELERHATVLRRTSAVPEADRSREARREHDEALAAIDGLAEAAAELPFALVSFGKPLPPYQTECPFPGLKSFTAADSRYFFGREALVESLRQRLRGHPFLAVLGASGSGKSSVVLAGLLPALERERPEIKSVRLTPSHAPLASLESALASKQIAPDPAVRGAERPVVVVDQFEEAFTLCPDPVARAAFFERLLDLAGPLRVVVTMRADFWGECAAHARLRDAMQAHQQLVGAMTPEELRSAIEQQARAADLRLEAGLSQRILDHVTHEPGAMPLLQHALLELWRRRHGRWLKAEEYERLGGVQRAIARTADDIFEALSPEEQARMRDLFLQLTRLDEEGSGGGRDTRRRAATADLFDSPEEEARLRTLISRLADSRLVVTSRDATTGHEEVEVAHEALIRHWPRLRHWIDDNRAALRMGQDLNQAAVEWEHRGRHAAYLAHRGLRLAEVAEVLAAGGLKLRRREREYYDACTEAQARERLEKEEQQRRELEAARSLAETRERARQRQRVYTWIAGVLAVAAVIGLVGALVERNHARQQERLAITNARESQERLIASLVEQGRTAYLDGEASRALLYSGRAHELGATDATTRSVLALAARGTLDAQVAIVDGVGRGAAISPDGKWLLAGAADRTARVYDLGDPGHPRLAATTSGHGGPLQDVAFAPDGRTAVTASGDGTARLWDLADPAHPVSLATLTHNGILSAVAYLGPGAARLVTGSSDGSVTIWDLSNPVQPRVVRELLSDGGGESVEDVSTSPDGVLVAAAAGNAATLYDAVRGGRVRTLGGHESTVFAVAFSPDGAEVVTGSGDRTARVWNASTGAQIRQLKNRGPVTAVAYTHDPNGDPEVVTASDRLRIWSGRDGRLLAEMEGHEDSITALAPSPDGRWLFTTSDDRTGRLWEARRHQCVGVLPPEDWTAAPRLTSAAFSPTRPWALTADATGVALMWDLSDEVKPKPQIDFQPPAGSAASAVNAVAFRPDGLWMATAHADGKVRLWDIPELAQAKRLAVLEGDDGHKGSVFAVEFSPDGKRLVTGSADHTARLWDVSDGAHPRLVGLLGGEGGHLGDVNAASFAGDGRWVITASDEKVARLWEVAAPSRPVAVLRSTWEIQDAAFSPDGKRVLLATGFMAEIWDLAEVKSPARRLSLGGHSGLVLTAAFSPDGRRVVTAGSDKTARLWDAASGQEIASESDHGQVVSSAAFNRSGDRVITASWDGAAHLWDVRLEARDAKTLAGAARRKVPLHWEGGHLAPGRSDPPGGLVSPPPPRP